MTNISSRRSPRLQYITKVKIFLLIGLIFLVPTILAQDFRVELKPHYFNNHTEVYQNLTYDQISFEVIGINEGWNRILSIYIYEISPQIFNDSINDSYASLRIKQKKTLWISNKMNIDEFPTNATFSISIIGVNESSNTELLTKTSSTIFIKKPKDNFTFIESMGNRIWEGNYKVGLGILALLIWGGSFIFWHFKGGDKLERWRDNREIKRIERKKDEEGWW